MTNSIGEFNESKPSKESYWRSVVLFGRNIASYKFSLAESLLEVMKERQTEVKLEDLAVPYSKNICEHLKKSPRQTTSKSSKFIEACNRFNEDEIKIDELINKYYLGTTFPIEAYLEKYDESYRKYFTSDQ